MNAQADQLSHSPNWIRVLICLMSLSLALAACDDGPQEAPQGAHSAGLESGAESGSTAGTAAGTAAGAESGAEAGESGSEAGAETPCEPDEGYEEAEAFLNESCGLCHGAEPQFGAPYSLIGLAELAAEERAQRLERSIARLLEGTMPPAGQPQPTQERAQAFIDWASCGQGPQRVSPPGGFEVSRPQYPSAGAPPSGAEIKEIFASAATIDPDEEDQYQCYLYSGPGEAGEERGILRFEPVIDDARVVHHIVLYEASDAIAPAEEGAPVSCGSGLGAAIYAWAPGQGALQFTEGALVSGGDKRYLLELHYNNSAGLEGVVDSSGVRIYHDLPQEPRIDMMTIGPDGFSLPPMSRTEVRGQCEVREELEVIALMPHMHELGVDISSQVRRAGASEGEWEDVISLRGWDFNFQLAYDAQGLSFAPGDLIETSCLFENDSSRTRRFGPFTEDEMCYQFIYVSPPPASRRCNDPLDELDYKPGACAPAEAGALASAVTGSYQIGEPPVATGGELPRGSLKVSEVEFWFAQAELGPITIDPEASRWEGAGALSFDDSGLFSFDVQGVSYPTSTQGSSFMLPTELSFAGLIAEHDPNSTELSLNLSCPEEGRAQSIAYSSSVDRFVFHQPFNDPVQGTLLVTFERP